MGCCVLLLLLLPLQTVLPCEVLTLIVPLAGHEHELGHVLVQIVLLVLGVLVVVGRLLGW